jgi:hypothetical protein
MKLKVTALVVALVALVLVGLRTNSSAEISPRPRPALTHEQPLIAEPSPAPVITSVQRQSARVAGGRVARRTQHMSSLSQYVALGLDSAPTGRVATIAVIDTAVSASARTLAQRVEVRSGAASAGANEHGTLIASSLTGSYSGQAMSNAGAATPAHLLFYGCALAGGIDLDCALQSLRAATDSGARVVNMSFETDAPIPAEVEAQWQAAVNAAAARGVLILAAAGDGPGLPFPARLAGVVSVSRLAGSRVVNRAARAAAPGTDLVVVNGAGSLVITGGSSYATAFVSAIAARIAGAKPGIGIDQLRQAASGRVTMSRAARIAGVHLSPLTRPGCAHRRGKLITWGRTPKAMRYRVSVGGLAFIVRPNRLTTGRQGAIRVQAIGPYGTLGPASSSC